MKAWEQSRVVGYGVVLLSLSFLALTFLTPITLARSAVQAEMMVRIGVPPILFIDAEPKEVIFTSNQVSAGEQADGRFVVEKGEAITLVTTGNAPHSLWISTATDSYAGPTGHIPVSRLQWRLRDNEWIPLSTELRLVRESALPVRDRLSIDLRLTLDFTDPPGAYEGDILLTLQTLDI